MEGIFKMFKDNIKKIGIFIIFILSFFLIGIMVKNINFVNKLLNKNIYNNSENFIYNIAEFQNGRENLDEKIGYNFNSSYTSAQKSISNKYNIDNFKYDNIRKDMEIAPFEGSSFVFWTIKDLNIKRINKSKTTYSVVFDLILNVECYETLPTGSGAKKLTYEKTTGKITLKNLKINIDYVRKDRQGNDVLVYSIPEETSQKTKQLFLTWDGRNPYKLIDILEDKKIKE